MMPPIDPSRSVERRLQERAEQLRQEIAVVRGRSEEAVAGDLGDAKDAADAGARSVVADAEMERDFAELCEISVALQRLADGSYGLCADCGQEIAPRRILTQLAALRCLECQAVAEGSATGAARDRIGHHE